MRALVCLFALVAAGCPKPTTTATQPPRDPACVEAEQLVTEASRLRDDGYLGRAASSARRAAELCPNERTTSAVANARQALLADRELHPDRATDEDKRRARLLYQAGQILRVRDGDNETSLERFRQSFELWPHPLTLVQMGLSHDAAGRAADARADYARALALAERLADSAAEPRLLRGHLGNIYSVVHHPTLPVLATTGEEHTIKLWDLTSGRIASTIEHAYGFELAFSPDGVLIAAADGESLRLWDATTGALARTLDADGASTVAFSPDGATIVTGTLDGYVSVWSPTTGEALGRWLAASEEGDTISALAISRDGALVVTTASDGVVRAWDPGGASVATYAKPNATPIAVALHPRSSRALIGFDDGTLTVWDIATNTPEQHIHAHAGRVPAVAFDASGARTISGGADAKIAVWSSEPGVGAQFMDHGQPIGTVSLSPDGDELASAGAGGTVRLWSTASGGIERYLDDPDIELLDVAFGEAFEVRARDTAMRWSATTGEALPAIATDATSAGAAPTRASSDGRMIATGSPTGVDITDGDGSPLAHLPVPDGVFSLAFSADDALLAAGTLAGAIVWDTRDWSQRATLAHGGGIMAQHVNGIAFHPSGDTLATASSNETIAIWRTDTWEPVRKVVAHELGVNGVAYSPDGSLLASASADNLAKLWSAASGEWLATLYPTPSGAWVVTAADGRVDGSDGDEGPALLYWQIGPYQLPGFVGWQRNHTPGLLAELIAP